MARSRDTVPDSAPDTVPEAIPETLEGHRELDPARALPEEPRESDDETLPDFRAPSSRTERAAYTTRSGTQISTFQADPLSLSGATQPSLPSQSLPRELSALPSGWSAMDERLRAVEQRLDRMEAHLRLIQKKADENGTNARANLIWWGILLAALLIAAVWSRLR